MKIYTITLNPAYDVHAYTEHFEPFHENLAHVLSKEAGGKGLNISRALQTAGIPNTALIIIGSENGADYKQHLSDANLDCLLFEAKGRIRENLTLHCADAPETRISFSGFKVSEDMLTQILNALTADDETVITFTGSLPDGIGMEQVKTFLQTLKRQGAKIVIDSRSFTLEDMYEVQPWLIKPNQEEISAFFGSPVENVCDAAVKAKEISSKGISNVMISLGEQGAVLAADNAVLHAMPPSISAISTIGAGDSSIAGFLSASIKNKSSEECLRSAVAFGTAACLTEGSMPPRCHDIDTLMQQIKITEVL